MNDSHAYPNSLEARLAVLEEQVRAFNLRLTAVSDRAYSLTGSMQGVVSSLEEARDKRADMIDKIDTLSEKMSTLATTSATNTMQVAHHVALCDRRAARLEKIGLAVLAAFFPLLGFLVYEYLQKTH